MLKTSTKIICAFVIAVSALLTQTASAQKIPKVLFVIVDGIPADVIEKVPTPFLDSIARIGGYARAHVGGGRGEYSETPTISAVGYNSLLTGTWVNKHNVWDNDIVKPDYSYPTIFRLLKDQFPEKKIAVFSTWLDNRTKLIGEGLEATGYLKMDFAFDGLETDTIQYPHDPLKKYIHRIDEAVTEKASETILVNAPDLSWVYLEYTDDMGHHFGDSEQFFEAVKIMDAQIGKLYAAVKQRIQKNNEDWQVYITTDHGRDSVTGKGHGGQSDRERSTWIVTNARHLNSRFRNGQAAIVDIMPTIARFMNIRIPRKHLMEIDGTPLTTTLVASDPSVNLNGNKLEITWKALSEKGNAKIWLATSDQLNAGGTDDYKLVATVPLIKQNIIVDITPGNSRIFKVVIETASHFLNQWTGRDLKHLIRSRK